MIPRNFIDQWAAQVPWQQKTMVEQDLIISRALVDLYNNDLVRKNLVFRGGTALNKLYIQPPSRYSEDIDFVQLAAGPIGKTVDAIRESLDPWLGTPKRKQTRRGYKIIYPYENTEGTISKLKIEINTTEHFQVESLQAFNFVVASEWFNGTASITTYQIDELIGTKLRALYQRKKGRDIFDVWFVLKKEMVDVVSVVRIFQAYCRFNNEPIERVDFEKNIEEKAIDRTFVEDMDLLLANDTQWDFDEAIELVRDKILPLL